jgi:predicted DCC family thiol-disulfide oxidoreductase YuxK
LQKYILKNMSSLQEIGDRLLVVYDGHCGLCNGLVHWLLKHDRHDRLRFAASASTVVAPLLAGHSRELEPDGTPGTVLVFRNPLAPGEQLFVRFAATLAVLHVLPQPWPAIAATLRWIPVFLTDPAYRLVARWRYRIWGRLQTCRLPTALERERFL